MPSGLLTFAFASKRSSEVRTKKEVKRDSGDSRSSKYIPVNVQELQNAESEIIKIVQGAAFPEDIISMKKLNVCEQTSGEKTVAYHNKAIKKASSLYQLDPFLDANGILRVGRRIRRSSLSYGAKHPIILPRKGHVTELIICHHHRIVEHQGRGITHNEIRSAGYWVIGGSLAVSNHIAQCVKCRKLRGTPQDQKMAHLPKHVYLLRSRLLWSVVRKRGSQRIKTLRGPFHVSVLQSYPP